MLKKVGGGTTLVPIICDKEIFVGIDFIDESVVPMLLKEIVKQFEWVAFARSRCAKDFKLLSKANRERVKNNIYSYRGGPTGYENIEQQLLEKQGLRSDVTIQHGVLGAVVRQNK
ncbi:hypothetical protein K1719_034623 [Acacia pycnantha]|nr:hypothetical protein K1719_034623 [Acacia pycnantha]